MKIDYKGYKYAVVTIQGGVLYRSNNHKKVKKEYFTNAKAHRVSENPDYKEEKQMENVYTQEMYEAGELPKVGMKVSIRGDIKEIKLGTDKYDNAVVEHAGEWVMVNYSDVKPIDTRTDKEKAIDETVKKLANRMKNIDAGNWSDDAKTLLNEIINGEIPNLTFTENKND